MGWIAARSLLLLHTCDRTHLATVATGQRRIVGGGVVAWWWCVHARPVIRVCHITQAQHLSFFLQLLSEDRLLYAYLLALYGWTSRAPDSGEMQICVTVKLNGSGWDSRCCKIFTPGWAYTVYPFAHWSTYCEPTPLFTAKLWICAHGRIIHTLLYSIADSTIVVTELVPRPTMNKFCNSPDQSPLLDPVSSPQSNLASRVQVL